MCSNERLIKVRKDRRLSLKETAKLCHLSCLSLKTWRKDIGESKAKDSIKYYKDMAFLPIILMILKKLLKIKTLLLYNAVAKKRKA